MTTYYQADDEDLLQRIEEEYHFLEHAKEEYDIRYTLPENLPEWDLAIRKLVGDEYGRRHIDQESQELSEMSRVWITLGCAFSRLIKSMHQFLTKTERNIEEDITPHQFVERFLS